MWAARAPSTKHMPKLVVRGRCHPPPYTDPKYKGWTIRASEVERVMPKYVGKPVHVEHDTSKTVGRVEAVFRDKKSGALVVDLGLTEDNDGIELMKRIHAGELGELSLGYTAEGDQRTMARTSEPEPVEISICKRGAMQDALIFGITVDDVTAVASQKSQSVYKLPPVSIQNSKMSADQQHEQAAPAPSEADPLAKYSKDELVRKVKLAEEVETRKLEELKEALANFIAPAWDRVKQTGALAGKEIGPDLEKIAATTEGRSVIELTAAVSGNFLKFEKMYLESQEEIKRLQEENRKLEASKTALVAEDERKTPAFTGIAPLFAVSNSAAASEEPAHKKLRIADMFNGSVLLTDVRNSLSSGRLPRPDIGGKIV